MCGIFTILNNKKTFNNEIIQKTFDKINNRGRRFSISL